VYGLAYVLIPKQFASLQVELDRTLAPFMRGGDKEFPREKLAFDDATDALTRLHKTRIRYNPEGTLSLLDTGALSEAWYDLRTDRLKEHLSACALEWFEGTFAEIEPDFDTFVRLFTRFDAPDAMRKRYGRWLNPNGYWDWWELGGRFNGAITGERRPAAAEQTISSGPSRGRAVMGNVAAALGGSTGSQPAEIDVNVELVETLKVAAERKERHSVPTALVLPFGCCPDEYRWFDRVSWHEIKPGTRSFLRASPDADFECLVRAAYGEFVDRVAAGVAYHF
jgi:hypothetical protein